MPTPETDLSKMLATLSVVRRPGEFVYATVADSSLAGDLSPVATVDEDEALTVVIRRETADENSVGYDSTWAWLTLSVYSALESVGLTAEVSKRLAGANIPANMLAGFHHDHILVPSPMVERALAALERLD